MRTVGSNASLMPRPDGSTAARHPLLVRRIAAIAVVGLAAAGLLGVSSPAAQASPVFTAIAAGDKSTCAVTSQGAAFCWGDNMFGQLGNGTTERSSVPVAVSGLSSGVTAISIGFAHACAVVNGGAFCWGANGAGQLGNGTTGTEVPVPVTNLSSGVTSITVGDTFSCATVSGGARCWGEGRFGQLGDGLARSSNVPVRVSGLSAGVSWLDAGSAHACSVVSVSATSNATELRCWGVDGAGQLGDGTAGTFSSVPGNVGGIAGSSITVSGGYGNTCSRRRPTLSTGIVYCWGNGTTVGSGTGDSAVPVQVTLPSADRVDVNGVACAVVTNGAVWCWGPNNYGQVGNGTATMGDVTPVGPVVDLSDPAADVATGIAHACALTRTGQAWCWGRNDQGQLGDGTFADRSSAVPVADGQVPTTSTTTTTTTSTTTSTTMPPAGGGLLTSLVPARLLDTRPGATTVDGQFQGAGRAAAGSTTAFRVTGRHGIPAGATAAVLNVTVDDATAGGYLTVYPCGSPRPNASSLNYGTGATIANSVISRIAPDGTICIFTSAAAQLLADAAGYFGTAPAFVSLNPGRLLDTRPGAATVDGQAQGAGRVGPGSVTVVNVRGRHGITSSASAAVLNITADDATGAGYLTVFPCGTTQPNTSNLNYRAGTAIANGVIARLAANGTVCIFSSNGAHLLADASGYFENSPGYVSLNPGRLLDTRPGGTTVDGESQDTGVVAGGAVRAFRVRGRHAIPNNAAAAVVNVTSTDASIGGFFTVFPCTSTRPNASNLNYAAGAAIANSVITQIGTDGAVCVYTSATSHMIVDVSGYFL